MGVPRRPGVVGLACLVVRQRQDSGGMLMNLRSRLGDVMYQDIGDSSVSGHR
ncbi:hypothetical protein GCM10009632_57250 [Mycolicibacterium alvei]